MGKTEKGYQERLKEFLESGTPKAKATTVALCTLALASLPFLVLAGAAMGNAIQLFRSSKTGNNFSDKRARSAFSHLKREKLIEYISDKDGKTLVKITKKGESKLRAFAIDLIKIKKQKDWDGKWRLVMFDIPVRFAKGRNALRWKLKDFEFYQFQKSAWIYPYPCEDEIIFIADFFGVGKHVEILTVENILRDEKIKKHFYL